MIEITVDRHLSLHCRRVIGQCPFAERHAHEPRMDKGAFCKPPFSKEMACTILHIVQAHPLCHIGSMSATGVFSSCCPADGSMPLSAASCLGKTPSLATRLAKRRLLPLKVFNPPAFNTGGAANAS